MTERPAEHGDPELPPPGSRWGVGAHSVLPYLVRTLRARPAAAVDASEKHASDGAAPRGRDGRPSA